MPAALRALEHEDEIVIEYERDRYSDASPTPGPSRMRDYPTPPEDYMEIESTRRVHYRDTVSDSEWD